MPTIEKNENPLLQQFVDNELVQISPLEQKSIELKTKVDSTDVTDDKTLAEAVKLRKEITSHITGTGKLRLEITRPLDNVKAQFIEGERRVLEQAEAAKVEIGKKIMTYEEQKAEEARQEAARIDEIIRNFDVSEALRTKKITVIDERGAELKKFYGELLETDQENPRLKLAFTQAINELLETRSILSKAQVDEAQAARDRAIRKAKEIEAAAAVQSETKKAVAAPKTGVRTREVITITDPALVPRAYCEPNMQMIREAVAAGVKEIPGVTITQERSF